jgi:hypothetical protein
VSSVNALMHADKMQLWSVCKGRGGGLSSGLGCTLHWVWSRLEPSPCLGVRAGVRTQHVACSKLRKDVGACCRWSLGLVDCVLKFSSTEGGCN